MKALQIGFGITEIIGGAMIGGMSIMLMKYGFIDNDNENDEASDICQKYLVACMGAGIAGICIGSGCVDIANGIKK